MSIDVNGIWTGNKLQRLVENPLPLRNPLIEQFMYERNVMMTYASSGVGKSVICLCASLQASAGESVFGFFDPVMPLKIYYVLGERDIYEPAERMQLMCKIIKILYDNFLVDEEAIGKNMLDRSCEEWLIKRIKLNMPDVKIVVFDPIYSLVSGGLSSPEKATAFAQFSTRVQKSFNCSIWHNNHTTKSTSDVIEGVRVDKLDPFMGSELLIAHINVMYYVTQVNNQVFFKCTKDSHNVALKKFQLNFNAESYTLDFSAKSGFTAIQKQDAFLNECKKIKKDFTFDEFFDAIQPSSHRYSEKLLGVTIKKNIIKNLKSKFENALYRVL